MPPTTRCCWPSCRMFPTIVAVRRSSRHARWSSRRYQETVVRGEWRGTLAREPHGINGFGYDPLFLPADASPPADHRPN